MSVSRVTQWEITNSNNNGPIDTVTVYLADDTVLRRPAKAAPRIALEGKFTS